MRHGGEVGAGYGVQAEVQTATQWYPEPQVWLLWYCLLLVGVMLTYLLPMTGNSCDGVCMYKLKSVLKREFSPETR